MRTLCCQPTPSRGTESRSDSSRSGTHGATRSGRGPGAMTPKNGTHWPPKSRSQYSKDTSVKTMANSSCPTMTTWPITREYSFVKWWMTISTATFHMNKTTNMARCIVSPSLRQESTLCKSARKIDVSCQRALGRHSSITSSRWWWVRR